MHTIAVHEIAWHGERIATACEDGYVRIWNAVTRELIQELSGHDTTIPGTGARNLHGLAFSPDGTLLYVGGAPAGTRAVTAYAVSAESNHEPRVARHRRTIGADSSVVGCALGVPSGQGAFADVLRGWRGMNVARLGVG